MIGFKSIAIAMMICIGTFIESYKLAFDNDNSVVKMESNRIVNGKVVGEPKPEEAIKELTSLGFKVSKIESDKGKDALKMLRARIPVAHKQSTMEIKPSEPIEHIFKKFSHLNEGGGQRAAGFNQNQNQNQNQDQNQSNNIAHNQLHDSKEIRQNSGYDIYITNVNENINVNNNTATN